MHRKVSHHKEENYLLLKIYSNMQIISITMKGNKYIYIYIYIYIYQFIMTITYMITNIQLNTISLFDYRNGKIIKWLGMNPNMVALRVYVYLQK